MAHTKSAEKKIRQYHEQRTRNQAAKSLIKTNTRKLVASLTGADSAATQQTYSELCSSLDKAVKRGNIKKQTAIRRKARATRKVLAVAKA